MNRYEPMNWQWKLVMAVVAIAVSAGLLDAVADGMNRPDATALAVRRQVIAAQADEVDRRRALERGEIKAAEANSGGQI